MGTTHKALVMSFSYSLSASVALALLFFPKLYIILMHPEKNIRASYTTTKLIRCHFGNSQAAYDSTSKQQHLGSKTTARTSVQSGSARFVQFPSDVFIFESMRFLQKYNFFLNSRTGAFQRSHL